MILDGNGNKTRKTDQLTRITNYVYDSMNRLTAINEPLSRSTTQTYDGNGNLATLTDPNGNVTTNTYDDADRLLTSEKGGDTIRHSYDRVGNLLSRTDAENRITRYTYDAMNRRLSLALDNYSESYSYDLAGNLTGKTTPVNRFSYTYDDLNRQLSESDNLGSVSGTSYDANGNVLSQIDANGNTTSYVYNALNFLTREEQPEGRNIVYTPDLFGNVLTKTDANGVAYSYVYDELNRLTSETHPNGSLSYTYDAVGNRRTLTDKRNNQTRYDYNDLNRLTLTTDPIGTFRNSYDDNGNVLTETDRRGLVNAYSYDAWDRVLTTTRAGLLIETNVYDGVGNRSRVTDANGNAIDYDYNHLDLVTEERAPLSATTRYSYNTGGQRISMTDPENRQTSYVPDARGRNLTETFQSLTTSYSYDGNGNLTGKTRPGGNSWSFVYDGANRLTSVTGPAGTTSYTYDHNDNRLSQTDAGTNTTGYAYDSNNLLRTLTYPDLTTETYAYDANGNRTSANLPNGNSWSATYDEDNRLITRSHNDGQSQTNSYDGNNNLTGVTFNNGAASASASYVYDNYDRQTRATDRNSHVVNYQYDDNGNRTQVSSTGGVTNYVYDALNRVTQVTGSDGVTGYSYDNSGLPTRVDYPSGISAITAYDAQGRIDTLTNQQGSTLLSSYDYAYDSNSNRTEQIEINGGAAETTGYSYDSADRLTQVDYPETSVVYTYDANFNRLSEVETRLSDSAVIKDQSYAYNNRNQLTGITDNLDAANNVTYSYDDNGNQTRKVKGTETTDFIYNARDELRQVQVGGSTVGQFLYDYQGMRVQKTGDRGVEQYHYDGKSVLAQYDETDQLIAHFQYGPNRLLSLQEPGGDAEYYLFDSLGSPVNLTTGAGAVTARYQYDAWGNKRSETGTSFNRFGFTGHEEDSETGLIYAKARYYDPDTGRFLNQDAYEGVIDTPPSLHRYLYAYANPTVYVDLYGYAACVGQALENCPDEQFIPDDGDSPLEVSDGAYDGAGGFTPAVHEDVPQGMLPLGTDQHIFTENYQLVPYVEDRENGDQRVIYYDVYNPKTKRVAYTIPPEAAKSFIEGDTLYLVTEGHFYGISGEPSKSNVAYARLAAKGFEGDGKGAAAAWVDTWKAGLTEPETYINTALGGTAGIVKAVPGRTVSGAPKPKINSVPKANRSLLTPTEAMNNRLKRLGYDDDNSARIMKSIENGEQIVVVGENMKRVNAVAKMVDDAGGKSVTYAPRNWNGLNRNSLEANRSWIRYWAKEKGVTVIDIGRQPTIRPFGPSPFYGVENRSLNRWGVYTPFKE